jgi:hypothetical protein
MPSLSKYLSSIDHDLLNRIAYHWDVDVEFGDLKKIESDLTAAMSTRQKVEEMLEILPPDAKPAWTMLLSKSNRIPWSEFSHKFGSIRELGPAARDRENPDQHPVNVTEYLYYRGLIARAFMDTAPEPREFAFIPDEIASLFHDTMSSLPISGVRPVPSSEIKRHQSGNTRLLDHMTDWLAQLRMDQKLEPVYFEKAQVSQQFLAAMAVRMKLVSTGLELFPEKIGDFLQADRLTTLRELFQLWKSSEEVNDLLMIPGLVFEGTWRYDPVFSRQAILQQLVNFDLQTWFSMSSFISRIKNEYPDFLRPAGDFDSWSIRKKGTKEYLSGREHWEDVEGTYIQYLFAGPLHWLGMVDLAYGSTDPAPVAFRISPIANYLLKPDFPAPLMAPETAAKLLTDLTIVMPVNSSRLLRYQVGRFTKIISNSVSETRFQISADSLTIAEKHGLRIDQLLQFLEKHVKLPLPVSFKKLAERWDQRRVEVKMEKATVMRVEDPEVIKILKDNPRTARLIRETLTEKIVILEPAGMEMVKKILLEAGILSQIELDV